MSLVIRSQPDFWSGLLFMAVGGAFAGYAPNYGIGTATNMGPGYFPLALGGLMVLIGLAVLIQSFSRTGPTEKLDRIHLKPLLLVIGPILLFGAILLPLGFVIASVVLIGLTALASPEFNIRYAVPLAAVLIAACYLIFVYGLGLPLPMWPGER